jgi:class 3 adenylate cyclase
MTVDAQRALELVLALDRIRDRFEDEDDQQAMFAQIVALLRRHFNADACAIALLADTSDEIEIVVAEGIRPDAAAPLCLEALRYERAQPLLHQPNSVGMEVNLRADLPLAGLVLLRAARPFDADEIALLHTAESQIDSAVIQAHTGWRLSQRNRELEAIYQIDRLRDTTEREDDLLAGFTSILVERFHADLCLILLDPGDSGDLLLRSVVDKRALPGDALRVICDQAATIDIPQVIPSPPGAERITLLAAPFIVDDKRLGAAVVGRAKPFTVSDHRLLHAIVSQMDTALVYSRVAQQLHQRKRELEVVYNIDRIRDRETDFDKMLQQVLNELCKAIPSELGFIMLYDEQQKTLQPKASTMGSLMHLPKYRDVIHAVAHTTLERGELVCENGREDVVRSIIAAPLILNNRIIGVFGALNSEAARGFSPEDRRILSAITSQVDTAVFEGLERRQLRRVLSRSVDPKVLDTLLQRADASLLTGERVVVSALFSDLRDSTEWAERTPPEALVSTLNTFFARMTDVIFQHGGTLDKYMGDQVIGLFGTPLHLPDHARRAAQAALSMQAAHRALQAELAAQGRELPPMGIGIASGEAIAGEFGALNYSNFTAMGRTVNLGARLCSIAEGGQILLSADTVVGLQSAATRLLGEQPLKGFSQPVHVYELLALNG